MIYRQTLKAATQANDKNPVQLYVVEEDSDGSTVTVYPLNVRYVERQHDGATAITLEDDQFDSTHIYEALNTSLNTCTVIFSDKDEAIRHANEVREKRISDYKEKIAQLTERIVSYEKNQVIVKL